MHEQSDIGPYLALKSLSLVKSPKKQLFKTVASGGEGSSE
jgi:hypothetical protein